LRQPATQTPRLRPAQVSQDQVGHRSSTWTRVRLNLRNIPPDQRPEQENLEVDYDPWNGLPDPRKISGESSTT